MYAGVYDTIFIMKLFVHQSNRYLHFLEYLPEKEELFMKSIILNGIYMEEPKEAHRYLTEKLNLPEREQADPGSRDQIHLGTLHECLSRMQNTHIEVFHSTGKSEYFQEIMQVFRDAGRENDDIIVTLE